MTTSNDETEYWSGYGEAGAPPMTEVQQLGPEPPATDPEGAGLTVDPELGDLQPEVGPIEPEPQTQPVGGEPVGTRPGEAQPGEPQRGEQGSSDSEPGVRAPSGDRQDPVVEVPAEHQDITADTTLADEKVGVLDDGGVVDTRGEDTVITTRDGVQVTRRADGTVTVDADISNNETEGENDDVSELHGDGVHLTEDGTKIRIDGDKVVVTQLDGTRFTIEPDGEVEIDLPDRDPHPEDPEQDKTEEPQDKGEDTGGGGNTGGGGGGGGDNTGGGGDTEKKKEEEQPKKEEEQPKKEEEQPKKEEEQPKKKKEEETDKEDTEFNVADLRADARTYADRSHRASGLSRTFDFLRDGVPAWGLWINAAAPYGQAIDRCVTIYKDAAAALDEMSAKLEQTASEYEKTEQQNAMQAQKVEA